MDAIRGKKGGIVTGTIFGIGGLIIGVIVILVITSTIGNAGLIADDQVSNYAITNESITFVATNVVKNLAVSTQDGVSCGTITYVANQSTTGQRLTTGNFTQVGCTLINATALNSAIGNGTIYVSYPYALTDSYSKDVVTTMRGNFTEGIGNVSSKLPTILLIVAVVFLFGALVLLVRQAGLMGIGSGNNGSL